MDHIKIGKRHVAELINDGYEAETAHKKFGGEFTSETGWRYAYTQPVRNWTKHGTDQVFVQAGRIDLVLEFKAQPILQLSNAKRRRFDNNWLTCFAAACADPALWDSPALQQHYYGFAWWVIAEMHRGKQHIGSLLRRWLADDRFGQILLKCLENFDCAFDL